MKNTFQIFASTLAAGALSLTLMGSAAGQTADSDQAGVEQQKPVINSYENDERNNREDLSEIDPAQVDDEESTLQRSDQQKPVLETYNSKPSPPGDYDKGQQPEPSGTESNVLQEQRADDDELSEAVEEPSLEGERGDSQKPILETYNSKPSPPGDFNRGQQPPPADGWDDGWFSPREAESRDVNDEPYDQ